MLIQSPSFEYSVWITFYTKEIVNDIYFLIITHRQKYGIYK